MTIARFCLLILIAGFVFACVAPVNLHAERESLLAADVRFDELSGDSGPASAFSKFLVNDALILPRNGPAVTGLENIAKSLAGEYSLRWIPQDAVVSERADMGYTWGNWLLTVDTDSGVLERRGKYLNVWVKRNGEWKVLVDIGNQADPLPE
jgi:ketosteroid isomerase-like protein